MGKYRANIPLPNGGYIEYEDEDENTFLENLQRVPNIRQKAISILSEQAHTVETGGYPNIAKPHSVPDAIEKLLSSDWGKIPRTLHELHSGLALNAVHVTKEALGATLTKLIKTNRLSRVKRNGVYAYTLPLQRR